MPQAKLPDTNAAWVRYRNFGLESIRGRDYAGAYGAIQEINALLPKDYRCEVNTQKYQELTETSVKIICNECEKEIRYNDIEPYTAILSIIESFTAGSQTDQFWDCPKCSVRNRLGSSDIMKDEIQKPNFVKTIPEPPQREEGIMDRTTFHNNFVKWFYTCLAELDHQLGRYRDEYKPIDEEEEETIEGGEIDD